MQIKYKNSPYSPEVTIQNCLLYRYFDGNGRLLYIGVTFDFSKRNGQHKKKARWHPMATDCVIEYCDCCAVAKQLEVAAIKSEVPRYNIKHYPQMTVEAIARNHPHFQFNPATIRTMIFDGALFPEEIDGNLVVTQAEWDRFKRYGFARP